MFTAGPTTAGPTKFSGHAESQAVSFFLLVLPFFLSHYWWVYTPNVDVHIVISFFRHDNMHMGPYTDITGT